MKLYSMVIDHSPIDIVLADENSGSQPYLTVITDQLSGTIVSVSITSPKTPAEGNDSDPDL